MLHSVSFDYKIYFIRKLTKFSVYQGKSVQAKVVLMQEPVRVDLEFVVLVSIHKNFANFTNFLKYDLLSYAWMWIDNF